MARFKKLSEAEWQVMNGIWHFNKPVSVRDIHNHLYAKGEKAYTTVQTIMNILFDKGFLRRDKVGMVNFYFPVMGREDFARQEARSLISRMFEGSFGAFASFLVDDGELSDDELAELRAMIEAREKDNNRNQS